MRRALFAVFAIALSVAAHAQSASEEVIYSFCQQFGCPDGSHPTRGMALLSNNSFVVTTDGNLNVGSNGSLVMLTPVIQGNYTANILAEFCYDSFTVCPNGNFPIGTPMEALNGDLYFSNLDGGLTSYNPGPGTGIMFQSSPPYTGSLNQFFVYCSDANCAAGGSPLAGLTQGTDGDLYGSTTFSPNGGVGGLFRIDSSANITALYNFCSLADCADGGIPTAPLLQAADGNFYGTTLDGGANQYGVLFRWNIKGFYSVVHTFCSGGTGCPDGASPVGALVQADNGNIYGVTSAGGNSTNGGTVFYIDPTGGFHTYVDFGCILRGVPCIDGETPTAGLIFGSDGNLYGATTVTSTKLGGQPYGAAFKLPLNLTNSSATNIFYYCAEGDPCLDGGSGPEGELVVGADANLYGIVIDGGPNNAGAAYALTTSSWLQPPVQLSFSSSSVAANTPVTLTWTVPYAYSKTAQLCGAFIQDSPTGAGTWTGLQTGSYANHAYSGSSVITPTAEGTYTYALTCGGRESGFAILTVTPAVKTSSATALAASPNPVTSGQSVTLKATVTGSSGTPGGAVIFSADGVTLGSASLNGSGIASFTASTNGIPPATYPVTASYSGNTSYNSSNSSPVNVKLGKATTATVLTVSPDSVTPPANETLTATVKRTASGATGVPTGSVIFYADGTDVLATVELDSSGVVNLTASSKGYPAGKYTITAKYLGDASDASSISAAAETTVK